jgi:hypothetical protein
LCERDSGLARENPVKKIRVFSGGTISNNDFRSERVMGILVSPNFLGSVSAGGAGELGGVRGTKIF